MIFFYKKYQDKNAIAGIFVTGFLFLMPLLGYAFYNFLLMYFISFIFGFFGGLLNRNFLRGLFSGGIGILLSWILLGVIYFSSFRLFFSGYYFCIFIVPTMLLGAAGGLVAGLINEFTRNRTKLKMQKIQETHNNQVN